MCAMSSRSEFRNSWRVRASTLANNTHNLIRDIVENLKVQPNPNLKPISLSLGDPTVFGNLTPPNEVLQAVRDVVSPLKSRSYGPAVGFLEARRAVAEAQCVKVGPEDVILSSGCSNALEIALTVLADSGQNVLAPRPGYMIYKTQAEGLGINIKFYDLLPDQQWKVDLDHLESIIDEDTVAIIVNNPSNPCGSVYDKEHLNSILEIASRNHLPIIADEIYEYFVFPDQEFFPISSLSTNVPVLTCSGTTKRYLIPGWRMGWLIIHDPLKVLGPQVRQGFVNMACRILGPSTVVQQALPGILKNTPQSFFDEMNLFIESQAKLAFKELSRAPGLRPAMPQGSMYMMIELKMSLFPNIKTELQFIECLHSEQAVICLPGQCFYYPNYMRIVLTVPEDILREACQRIIDFCQNHCSSILSPGAK